ncbi:MAG: protein-arginine deiminase family protein, partial [Myxococcota bacterium]|nr:protein-arginine deiminase family protein [Myxococcota bacterium]
GFANIDDDDRDGRVDYGRDAEGEDDRFDLVLPDSMFVDAPGGGTLQLQLRGDVDAVRVLDDGMVLLDADEETTGLDIPADGLALAVEFGSMAAHAWLDVELQDAGGEVIESMRIGLQSAPLILNHHLQPVERVFAMSTGDSGGNAAFTNGFADALDDRFETFRLSRYGWDVWIQDEIELATLTAPDGRRMDVVIDSIRNRAGQFLGALPEEEFEAPGFAVETWGRGRASSQDSFGNLEVSPPVTVDGVLYPFGRAYHGRWFRDEMHEEMVSMLEAQRVQDPFEIDVGFLCVGHVDEFTTFVPDPSSDKGFRFVVADVALAYAFLEAQRGSTRLPRYASDHGYGTIGDLVDDRALRAMNEEIQEDYIDPAVETFKAELGLTEADITRIPALFEEVRGCGGTTAGLIPGTANMTVAPLDSGETHLFLPDPFLRPSGDGVEDDPFVAEIERLLPGGLAFHWLDDWDYYHTMLGEVHCGSNAVRTPIDDWWVAARHLLADGEEE